MIRTLSILLIEDNKADVRTVHRILQRLDRPWTLEVRSNGRKALRRLEEIRNDGSPVPDLILLDLNLPRVHGLEVLRQFKQTEDLEDVPVIILTTSMDERDRKTARDLGIEAFIRKPDRIKKWKELLLPRLRSV